MIPLLVFLLACATVYVGTVTAAFSTLMRLSLRLEAERSDRHDILGPYLDDPMRLFIPARLLLSVFAVAATALSAGAAGVRLLTSLPLVLAGMTAFVLVCEHILPLLVIRRDPERVLEVLLPSFDTLARPLRPLTNTLLRPGRRDRPASVPNGSDGAEHDEHTGEGPEADAPTDDQAPHTEASQEAEDRQLLRSIVDFRETLVREVMTPRPDIVAIEASATLGDLRRLLREQEYSRVPVFQATLDNILGFIFVKDLVQLEGAAAHEPIRPLLRPAYFVPETKKVPSLLKEFQRQRVQSAIVVDEYGGTAGLVTIEDLLEELVGEIRDEYDVEVEPVVDEGNGIFVFSGKADVDALARHLGVDVERQGFDSVGGFLLAHLGRVPSKGETFDVEGLAVEVLEAERRRVTRVRMRRREAVAEAAAEEAS